jgi:hypothetical protein
MSTSYKILSNIFPARLTLYADEIIGIISMDFDVIEQRFIRFSVSGRYWRKKCEYNGTVHQLFIDFNKTYFSVR